MYLARNSRSLPYDSFPNGTVVTIGAYDGLHLGHRRLLSRVVEVASRRGVPSVVMSFEPTPKEFLAGGDAPVRLMRFREKFLALADFGIDLFFCQPFNRRLRSLSADTFVRQLLVHALDVRHLVVGDDFQFAARRSGNIELLSRFGAALGFDVERVDSVTVDGRRVSSTAVREALALGELDVAKRLLGGHYCMTGKVTRGEGGGHENGFRTLNVNLNRRVSPVLGIFAVQVSGTGLEPLGGVASVEALPGPGGSRPRLEIHLFDCDREIDGETVRVEFVARLRSGQELDGATNPIEQMHRDSTAAREILAT